jgi:hypothetical protein
MHKKLGLLPSPKRRGEEEKGEKEGRGKRGVK